MRRLENLTQHQTTLVLRLFAGVSACAGGYVSYMALRDLASLRFHASMDYFGVFVLTPAMLCFGGWCLRASYLGWRRPAGKELVHLLILGFMVGFAVSLEIAGRILDQVDGARDLWGRYSPQIMFAGALLFSLLYYRCRLWLSVHGALNAEQRAALRQPPSLRWSHFLGYWLWFSLFDILRGKLPFEKRYTESALLELLIDACILFLPFIVGVQFCKRLHRHLCRLMAAVANEPADKQASPSCP